MIKHTLPVIAVIAACALLPWGLYECFGKAGLIAYAILSGLITFVGFCSCAINARRPANPKYPTNILK